MNAGPDPDGFMNFFASELAAPLRTLAPAAQPTRKESEEEMAKHDTNPVLAHLVRVVNESGRARVPVTVSAQGAVVTGVLIAQAAYFAESVDGWTAGTSPAADGDTGPFARLFAG